eukprot:scaffold1107_cov75-Phaeocystis_antarctica.AAC.2
MGHGLQVVRRQAVARLLCGRRLCRRRSAFGGGCAGVRVCPRDCQGRLLGGDEGAEVHLLAGAFHKRLVEAGAACMRGDPLEAGRRIVVGLQLEPLCRRLRNRLSGRERRRLGRLRLRLRLPLGRPCVRQGCLLGGSEGTEVHILAGAPDACLVAAWLSSVDPAVARRVVLAWLQRQPLRLRLSHGRLGCPCLAHLFVRVFL